MSALKIAPPVTAGTKHCVDSLSRNPRETHIAGSDVDWFLISRKKTSSQKCGIREIPVAYIGL